MSLPSLAELDLLPGSNGDWPLASWLDHTHSAAGHRALKKLIAEPLTDAQHIRHRQALLAQLAPLSTTVPWSDLRSSITRVESYLGSNYVIVPSGPWQRWIFALRFRPIVQDIESFLRSVDALLTLSEHVYTRLTQLPIDAQFATVMGAMAAAIEHPSRTALRSAVTSGRGLLGLDHLIRSDATAHAAIAGDSPEKPISMPMALQALIAALAQLDALCSLAVASASVAGSTPAIATGNDAQLMLEELRHPLLSHGVANSLALTAGERVLLLTGPNMAGKSTLMRAIGIAAHCTRLGMRVAARSAHVPVFDQIRTSINAQDNLRRGESLYLGEVRRIRAIVETAHDGVNVLALCDEAFRGTNVVDAREATGLLIDGLARSATGTFILSSHLTDVVASRAGHRGVSCWCMEVDAHTSETVFNYRLVRGISTVQLGMTLLDAEGVGPLLRQMAARSPADQ